MSKTVITNAGRAAAVAASGGPQIIINKVRFGSNIIDPTASMTDVAGFAYEASASALRYSVRDDNSVVYRITLDESVGDFLIGNIGLVLADGTVFAIASLDAQIQKTKTAGDVVGNRRQWVIPLVLSNLATITNLTVLLQDTLSIPEVATQAALPAANSAPYNTYLVRQHTGFSNRAAFATAVAGSWRYYPEDLGGGAAAETNAIVMTGKFNAAVTQGKTAYFNDSADEWQLANVSTNPPRGIRGTGDSLHTGGSYYTHGSNAFDPGKIYYAQADGTISTNVTAYEAGIAIAANKLFVTMGLVQGQPWGGGGGYTAGGRVKTAFLTGPAWWASQYAGQAAASVIGTPAAGDAPSTFYHVFPKTSYKMVEVMFPLVKSMNRAVAANLILYWLRPASPSAPVDVHWRARHSRIAQGVANTNPMTGDAGVIDAAASANTYYKSDAIALDFSGYGAEEIAQIQLYRAKDDAGDTLLSDAYFLGALIKYTEATDTDA